MSCFRLSDQLNVAKLAKNAPLAFKFSFPFLFPLLSRVGVKCNKSKDKTASKQNRLFVNNPWGGFSPPLPATPKKTALPVIIESRVKTNQLAC